MERNGIYLFLTARAKKIRTHSFVEDQSENGRKGLVSCMSCVVVSCADDCLFLVNAHSTTRKRANAIVCGTHARTHGPEEGKRTG